MSGVNFFVSDPRVLAAMQTGYLERQFLAPLRPACQYRQCCTPEPWNAPGAVSVYKTRHGTMAPNLTPLPLGVDPQPGRFDYEQWLATIERRSAPLDGLITEARYSIPGYLSTRLSVLGINAGQTLNRMDRQALYNAALSGQTVVTSQAGDGTTKAVSRINGFTVAFNASTRKFEPVSASNPLPVYFRGVSSWDKRYVIGVQPDKAGDEFGPGTLTLSVAYTSTARQPLVAETASKIIRSGGGYSIDDIATTDVLTVSDLRQAVGRLKTMNVPRFADGFYKAHLSTASANQLRSDPEFQYLYRGSQLNEADKSDPYVSSLIAVLEGCRIYENQEAPDRDTVPLEYGADGGVIAVETANTTEVPIHTVLVVGDGCAIEYQDQPLGIDPLLQGQANGRVGGWEILPNGIRSEIEGVQVTIRGPMNSELSDLRLTWSFYGAPSIGTDYLSATPGSAYSTIAAGRAAYKRCVAIQHGSAA